MEEIRTRFEEAKQSHVFDHYDKLSESEKESFLEQLDKIQVDRLASLVEAARKGSTEGGHGDIQPFSGKVLQSTDSQAVASSEKVGIDAIGNGEVAALVLAGGQGTRLGFDGPKGMYNIQLPSNRTLFQMMAERIVRLKKIASSGDKAAVVPFYIMTSPLNHDETVSFFQSKDYFGLDSSCVFFFPQGMLPCLTEDGKMMMESAGRVAMAPDGNGGIYPSLARSGALEDMGKRGIKYLHVFSIDNALVKPADPAFIGYCIEEKADCGNKVVWKAHPHEKVGVVATRAGKPCIVEYSEITTEMAESTDEKGRLRFGAANICNHFYTLDFIRDKILPNMSDFYHIAKKKIPFYDAETKQTITPTSNNGIKLETFIFDVFPFSERMAVMDVARQEEFSPVKNKEGSPSDSPDTARAMISALAKQRVRDAGGNLTGDVESSTCEISPLTSYSGEGLEELVKGKDIACPFSL